MELRNRRPGFYRLLLALPVLMLGFLVLSGRFSRYWRLFHSPPPSEPEFNDAFLTAVLWVVSVAPLLWVAWLIGREHVAARRHGYDVLVGLREVIRRAAGRTLSMSAADSFTLPPRDKPRVALIYGGVVAVLMPTFFASAVPFLRTMRGVIWLGVAGLLMGSLVYARYRAMAYLRDEPGRWDMFRQYRLMNPSRYEEAGRAFVRWQLFATLMLFVWWLGGGVVLISP